jgi:hypothetical protein
LCEQSRGKRFNWNNTDETGDTIISNRGDDDWNKADKTANTTIPNPDDENSKIMKPSLSSPPLSPPCVTKAVIRAVPPFVSSTMAFPRLIACDRIRELTPSVATCSESI